MKYKKEGFLTDEQQNYNSAYEDGLAAAHIEAEIKKPSPEPVAWWDGLTDTSSECMVNALREKHINIRSSTYKDFPIPLYTSPPVREPANEEAINAIFYDAYKMFKKHQLSVRGQTITLSDSTDYWIVVATEKHHGIG